MQFWLPGWPDVDELPDEQLGGYGENFVTSGYFETLGMQIIRGRGVLETDRLAGRRIVRGAEDGVADDGPRADAEEQPCQGDTPGNRY